MATAVAAVLLAGGLASPLTAHALVTTPLNTASCQVTGLTVDSLPPVSPAVVSATTSAQQFNLNATGACSGAMGNTTFSVSGSGWVVNSGTCAAFASVTGGGYLDWGGQPQVPIDFYVAGAGASGVFAIDTPAIVIAGTIAGSFDLTLSVTSLQSCAAGLTTMLQYTGQGTLATS